MGADYLQGADSIAADQAEGGPIIGIGDGSVIEGAILDKNCRIGSEVNIRLATGGDTLSETGIVIRDGIAVVPKGAELNNGWQL